eukprot:1866332-Rhodomonas_salina.1
MPDHVTRTRVRNQGVGWTANPRSGVISEGRFGTGRRWERESDERRVGVPPDRTASSSCCWRRMAILKQSRPTGWAKTLADRHHH